tara:strand:- start:255 stop:911 length:657 start_codon:yes stop_codon:yes gene_type:complete
MVKNTIGGNKSKKFANKNFNIQDRATRFAKEEGELYAYVEKLMGNNICQVMCIDGYQRSCVIRGKFLGKGKRDNILTKGKWILVGLRDWENGNKGSEKEKCDLLEVYSDMDKQRLQNDSTIDFGGFLKNEQIENEFDDSIKFTNDDNLFFSEHEDDDDESEVEKEDEDDDSEVEKEDEDDESEVEKEDENNDQQEKSYLKIDVKTINDQFNKVDIDDI